MRFRIARDTARLASCCPTMCSERDLTMSDGVWWAWSLLTCLDVFMCMSSVPVWVSLSAVGSCSSVGGGGASASLWSSMVELDEKTRWVLRTILLCALRRGKRSMVAVCCLI